MSAKYFCDCCGEAMTAIEYREPRPNATMIIADITKDICPKCVDAFMRLDRSAILKQAVLEHRAKQKE